MHDEVSDTENIRKNLAIERMIVEGCDILLDTSQTFVRQGQLFSHIHTLIYKQSHTQRNKCIQQTAKKIIILSLCLSTSAGSLIQLPSSSERGMLSKVRLVSLSLRKEGERQCFLFTKHFLICTRTSGGKLHLLKVSPAGHANTYTHTYTLTYTLTFDKHQSVLLTKRRAQ